MTPGEVPDEHASAPHGAGGPGGAGNPAPAERRRRLQDLAGLTVRGIDGGSVGRVRDIYQQDAGTELAAITVVPRQLSSRSVLIPAVAIASLPPAPADGEGSADGGSASDGEAAASGRRDAEGNRAAEGSSGDEDGGHADGEGAAPAIELRVDVATAKAGARPPITGHVTSEELRDAAAALGLGTGQVA